MMLLFGSPMSQPVSPTVLASGKVSFVHLKRPGSGSLGVIARVPQKNGLPWPKMLVPPPPSSVNILYWAVPSSIAPEVVDVGRELRGVAGLAELGDGLLAGRGVAGLVVVVLDVDRSGRRPP